MGVCNWVIAGAAAVTLLAAAPTLAETFDFPAGFRTQNIETNGTVLHVRVGGAGPAVVLIHGYGDTGDMWRPLAADLMRDHTVIAPDLRGMGLSARAGEGYEDVLAQACAQKAWRE